MEPAGEARRDGEGGERGGSSSDSEPDPSAFRYRRVSFADAFGLDLVSVKEFCSRQTSAADDAPPDPDPDPEEFLLRSQFSVPASAAELLARLEAQPVELECVELLPGTTTLRGVVRVLNLCYHKAVCVRTTLDGWATRFDLPAHFVPGSSDGKTDRFAFTLQLAPPFPPDGARVEFCLRYQTPAGTFWANNSGVNYVLLCQQRGGRDGRGKQAEDPSLHNKKSCLKSNSKERSSEANTAGNTDVLPNKQEVDVDRKIEEPASNSDGFPADTCGKSLVEGGRSLSRRSRRRLARRAQMRSRARDSRDADGEGDTYSRVMWDWSQRGRRQQVLTQDDSPQHSAEAEPEEQPLPLTYAADEPATPHGPRETSQGLGHLSTDTAAWGTTDASETAEGEQAGVCAKAEGEYPGALWDSGVPQGTLWDPTAQSRTLWYQDMPGLSWDLDAPQEVCLDPAATLSGAAAGQESSSPQAGEEEEEEEAGPQRAAPDRNTRGQDYREADIIDETDADPQHSRPVSGDRTRMDTQSDGLDSGFLWPSSSTFKFETFVAPLYQQVSCRSRPEGQDLSGGQWAGEQASDDSDDEAQTAGEDSCGRLSAIANAQPIFHTPARHQLSCSGEILESATDNSLSTDTDLSKQERQDYGQENAAPPSEESSDQRAERTLLSGVQQEAECKAEVNSDKDVPHRAETGGQDKEHLLAAEATEGTRTLGEAETKTDAMAMLATLSSSNINATEAFPAGDCSRTTLFPLVAYTDTERKQYALMGDHVNFTQAFSEGEGNLTEGGGQVVGEKNHKQVVSRIDEEEHGNVSEVSMGSEKQTTDFMTGGTDGTQMDQEVSLDQGHMEYEEKEKEFLKPEAVSEANQGLHGLCLFKNEDLGDQVSTEDEEVVKDVDVKNEDLDYDEASVEDEDLGEEEMSMEDEDLDDDDDEVRAEDENLYDDEVSVEDEELDKVSVEDEDLDDDEVSVEDEDLDDDEVLEGDEDRDDEVLKENEDLDNYEVLKENEDLDNDEVLVEDEDLDDDEVLVEDEDLDDEVLKENEDLDNDEVLVEDEDLDYKEDTMDDEELDDDEVSVGDEDLDSDEVSVEGEDLDETISLEYKNLSCDNLDENEDLDNEVLPMENPEVAEDLLMVHDIDHDLLPVEEQIDKYVSMGDEQLDRNSPMENTYLYGDNLNENDYLESAELSMENPELPEDISLEHDDIDSDAPAVEEETGKYMSVGDEDLERDWSAGNNDPCVEKLPENDERLSVENKDLDNKVSSEDEGLDDDGVDKVGEETQVDKDLDQVKLETSTGKEVDPYDPEEVFFIDIKYECHDRRNEVLKEREDLDEGVGVVFGGQELDSWTDLKADVLIREDIHLHTDRAAVDGETESHVEEVGEVYKDEGKQSMDGGGCLGEHEGEVDSISTDSQTDDEMELHIHSVNAAYKQQLARGALGNSRGVANSAGKRPSVSRARAPPTTLSSISESLNEDGDMEEESGLSPVETVGDHNAATQSPIEKVDNEAGTWVFTCGQSSTLGQFWRAVLYALLCALFFFTAYHYDFLACFALYLFSVFWLCFHGEKQRLQETNREE